MPSDTSDCESSDKDAEGRMSEASVIKRVPLFLYSCQFEGGTDDTVRMLTESMLETQREIVDVMIAEVSEGYVMVADMKGA